MEVNSIAPPPSLQRECPRAREVKNVSTQLPQPRFKMIAISIISLTQVAIRWLPVGSRLWHIFNWDEIT
jgi:hypothetical protein